MVCQIKGNKFKKKSERKAQYKLANEKFLEQKAQEEGIEALESGILIDGTVFDSTDGQDYPAAFKVRDLIVSWQASLLRMHAGDKYEIFIPARYAYGSMSLDGIPANSTLIFTLELVRVH